jgi:hypothetical protein
MAEIVAAVGVPHTPQFPALVASEGSGSETGQLYAAIRRHLEAARADHLLVFDSDHLNTFFLDNLPALSVPLAERATGSNDGTIGLPDRDIELMPELGERLLARLTADDYFPSRNHALAIDHSVMVPLHFLDPNNLARVLPVYINGIVPPLPSATRCYALGQSVRTVVEEWDSPARVAIVASGSFSLEVGGARIPDNSIGGVPDPEWAAHVNDRLRAGYISQLIEEATSTRMRQAGNVGGELLNWIALLGVVGPRPPDILEPQPVHGHSFAAWSGS